jgi:hypothetical protein
MTMPLDPYAPPTAALSPAAPGAAAVSDYGGERRSLLLVIALTVGTLGLYPVIWLWRRQPFLDRLDAEAKLGAGAPIALLVLNVASFGLLLADVPESVDRAVNLGLAAALLALNFKVAAMLRSDFARTGRMLDVKSVWVFFLGTIYLQHVINKAAESPARIEGTKAKAGTAKAARADAEASADAQPGVRPEGPE